MVSMETLAMREKSLCLAQFWTLIPGYHDKMDVKLWLIKHLNLTPVEVPNNFLLPVL